MSSLTGRAGRDANREPVTFGVSSTDGVTVLPIEINPATNRLLVDSTGGGGGGGTQYVELATTSPATGTLALGRYQTSLPTLTNGQMNEPMLDVSSRLFANVTALPAAVTLNKGASDASTLRVSLGDGVQTVGSIANTAFIANAGTNLNTSLLALESGGNLATLAGSVSASVVQTNVKQMNGVATSMNNGTTDTGTLRVTLSSDSTGQVKLAAGANVIGSISNTSFTANIGTTNGLALDATLTNATQQTKITNGTNIADVLAGDSGLNSVVTASGTKTYTFTTSTPGAQTLLANTSLEGYSWVEVIYTAVGSGLALTGQFAPNTGGTYINTGSIWSAGTTGNGPLGTTVSTLYAAATHGNFFQLSVTALTSGTFSGYVILRATPPPNTGVLASQNGNWSLQGNSATATGTITTSASSISGTTNNGYGGFTEVSIHGTYAGVSFGITESDDTATTFYNVPIYDSAANAWLAPGATITPGTNASKTYWVPNYPTASVVKVLASAYTSGTGTIRILAAQTNLPGSTMAQLMDAAGNNRGANVDASSNLMVDVAGGLMPTGTALNTYSIHLTTNTTTTPTSSTAYISSIAISNEVAGTTSTITIQDKQGTPLKLINGIATTALTTAPTIVTFPTPVKMVSGIDIITAGAVAATVDVWVNYYQ
jgi:hypothetical protein